MAISSTWRLIGEFRRMPRITVDLMHSNTAGNDPFYGRLVKQYHVDALRLRPPLFLFPSRVYGVALCQLPATFDKYYMLIEAAARRNHKKAVREACSVRRIQFNDHLAAIAEIRRSTDKRQGRLMPQDYREGVVSPCTDPPSSSPWHDYPYFGVFAGEKLVGYAGCFVAGELCSIEHILGHAEYLTVGAVPLLIIGIAAYLYERHPGVRAYTYGTYFGAGETMRRFKRKFGFVPHRVDWALDARAQPAGNTAPALACEACIK